VGALCAKSTAFPALPGSSARELFGGPRRKAARRATFRPRCADGARRDQCCHPAARARWDARSHHPVDQPSQTRSGRTGDALIRNACSSKNGISEPVQFFHIDALSSMVGMKGDFDMQRTLLASSLYRMMAQRIGREYSHSQAKTVFRNLLNLSGKVEVNATSVVVTLDKRAHNPYLSPLVWPISPRRCLGSAARS
jgi:hypothetical protein